MTADPPGKQFVDDLPVGVSSRGSQRPPINRFLDTVGDGSGTKQAIFNFSATPVPYMIKPAAGEIFRIARLIVRIKTTADIKDAFYGSSTTLTNGIGLRHQSDTGTIDDLCDGIPIKVNDDWGRHCFDFDVGEKTGKKTGTARWTFSKGGQYVRLVGTTGDSLQVLLNDDFSGGGFVDHLFFVMGYIEQEAA